MIKIIENFLPKYYLQELQGYLIDGSLDEPFGNWSLRRNLTGYEQGDKKTELGDIGFSKILFHLQKHPSPNGGNAITPMAAGSVGLFSKPLIYICQEAVEDFIGKPVYPIRCRADMTIYNSDEYKHGIHVDVEDWKHMTAILYVNNSNGNTLLYDYDKRTILHEIEPVENRLLIFDGTLPHTGYSPSENQYRILLNMNFFEEEIYDQWIDNELPNSSS